MNFYGVMLGDLPGGVLLNNFYSGAIISLVAFLLIFLLGSPFAYRKTIIGGSLIPSALAYLAMAYLFSVGGFYSQFNYKRKIIVNHLRSTIMIRISGLVSLALVNSAFTTLYMITAELLPTSIRARGFGFLSAFSRIGGGIGMQLLKLERPQWCGILGGLRTGYLY